MHQGTAELNTMGCLTQTPKRPLLLFPSCLRRISFREICSAARQHGQSFMRRIAANIRTGFRRMKAECRKIALLGSAFRQKSKVCGALSTANTGSMAFAGNTCNIKNVSEIIRLGHRPPQTARQAARSANIGRSDGGSVICPPAAGREPYGLNAEQRHSQTPCAHFCRQE